MVKIKCNIERLPDVPKYQSIKHEEEKPQPKKKRKKRDWSKLRRGINDGVYGRPVTFTPEQDAVILDMKKQGYNTYKQMSEEMGRNKDAIRSRYYKLRDRQ